MSDILIKEEKNKVGWIQLNRPDVFNSFNTELSFAVQDAIDSFENNKDVRVIVLTGKGKAFSAGQDIGELLQDNPPPLTDILEKHYNPIIKKIRNATKPVLCAVNGVAAGAGANIALACDITVAIEDASFIQAFSKIGLVPDSGGTFYLPRLIGYQKAMALAMLGDKITAKEALELNMIYKVVGNDALQAAVQSIGERLASLPSLGLAATKKAMNTTWTNSLDEQLSLESELQTKLSKSYDYNEGISAFKEKRKPKFLGK